MAFLFMIVIIIVIIIINIAIISVSCAPLHHEHNDHDEISGKHETGSNLRAINHIKLVHERFLQDVEIYSKANCSAMSHQLHFIDDDLFQRYSSSQIDDDNNDNNNNREKKKPQHSYNDKIIISGIVYNVDSDDQAKFILNEINGVGEQYSDYRAVIYDNDISGTPHLMSKISEYPKIYYIPQMLHHQRNVSHIFGTCAREQALAFMRSHIIRFVKDIVFGGIPGPISSPNPQPFDADWLVMLDLEEMQSRKLTAKKFQLVSNTFKSRMKEFAYSSFDIICSNALYYWGDPFKSCYHDIYALIPCEPSFYRPEFGIGGDWGLNVDWKNGNAKQWLNQNRIMTARMICRKDERSHKFVDNVYEVTMSDEAINKMIDDRVMMATATKTKKKESSDVGKDVFATVRAKEVVNKLANSGLVRVKSCFGGLVFYKIEAILQSDCEYDIHFSCDCEHLTFNTCLAMSGYNGIYVDKKMVYDRQ